MRQLASSSYVRLQIILRLRNVFCVLTFLCVVFTNIYTFPQCQWAASRVALEVQLKRVHGTSNTNRSIAQGHQFGCSEFCLLDLLRNLYNVQLWHDDTDAQYTCLSYVWGSEHDQHTILLNGSYIAVRSNLYKFLQIARTKYAGSQRSFWIDALCIDQSSILERNHQVARMGSIYTKAAEVIGWLGFSERIERALRFCVETSTLTPQSEKDTWKTWLHQRNAILQDWKELQAHEYWERAWITQEILSATKYKLLVNHFEADPTQFFVLGMLLPAMGNALNFNAVCGGNTTSAKLFTSYIETLCGRREFDRRLIEVLHQFPGRQSQIPRDRFYSLISIASDVDSFPIDYGSESHEIFLTTALHFRGSMCLCLWLCIASALEYPKKPYATPRMGAGFWVRMQPMSKLRKPYAKDYIPPSMPVFTVFLMPCLNSEDPQSRKCSDCGYEPIAKKGSHNRIFCTKGICPGVAAQHFWLLPASAPENSKRDQYPALRVQSVAEAHSSVEKNRLVRRSLWGTLYRIQLSAEILLELCQPISRSTSSDLYQGPLELCLSARQGHPTRYLETKWEKRQHVFVSETYVVVPV